MLSDFQIWIGIYTVTYQDELDAWVAAGDALDTVIIHSDDVPDDVDDAFWEDSGGLFSDKTILILGAEKWNAAMAQWVVANYKKMDVNVRLSMVFAGADPSPNTKKAADQINERRIPYDADEMAQWMNTWMKKRGVLLDVESCKKVAEHVRYDTDQLVQVLGNIVISKQGRVAFEDLKALLGKRGAGDLQDLVMCIVAGDRAGTAESMIRLNGEAPQYLFAILNARFRAITAVVFDPNVDLSQFGIYANAAHYVRRDATITKGRALRVVSMLDQAWLGMTGGGDGLTAYDTLSILTDRLAIICSEESLPARI